MQLERAQKQIETLRDAAAAAEAHGGGSPVGSPAARAVAISLAELDSVRVRLVSAEVRAYKKITSVGTVREYYANLPSFAAIINHACIETSGAHSISCRS